ncbi:MotA/TolQ/ExbB proton channel family protein [Shewanella youngdeokensis]|uniref:MotA/TolQ/ExbB proton channel family protein n=1 Tax=Shewanella youngdeokensis TaxID=2999068 RepID=A0ABZ0JX11_9GAMM|nr:MotA/TolQ/ExbB proton channel family protein [Shewanella sp. DAU334]
MYINTVKKPTLLAPLVLMMGLLLNTHTVTAEPAEVATPEKLLSITNNAQQQEQQHNQQRLQQFEHTEASLRADFTNLSQQIAQLEQQTAALAETFQLNEERLADKEKALHLATGSLGELFGVVRLSAKELLLEQTVSVASIGAEANIAMVDNIVAAKTLPSKPQLYGLWQAFQQQIQVSGQQQVMNVAVTKRSGETVEQQVLRMGAISLANEAGFLSWDASRSSAMAYGVQPELKPNGTLVADNALLELDVTRGNLLDQLAQAPTLSQRLDNGGIVGRVILGLMVIGLLIGLVQGLHLFTMKRRVNQQLKCVDKPCDKNPLGRILSIYQADNTPNTEAFELRVLEAVMDEQQSLERGLSLVKLFAALAPMLGLLGTVTGMIETFQTITQFGNADPRVMAGGISMALITTVLGLIAAMPLLLVSNVLNTQVESIRNIIEKQGVGLVAERAEQSQLQRQLNEAA